MAQPFFKKWAAAAGVVVLCVLGACVSPTTSSQTQMDDETLRQMQATVFREKAINEFALRMEEADQVMLQIPPGFDAAIAVVQDAINIIDANKRYFSEAEADAYRQFAQDRLKSITNQKAQFIIQREESNNTRIIILR